MCFPQKEGFILSGKRKDNNGRVLKEGESQRSNGSYCYRYTDIDKKRYCIYAKTLTELREKEKEIQRDIVDGISNTDGNITVLELVNRYINLKHNIKPSSMRTYEVAIKRLYTDPFGQRSIKSVKLSDAKSWLIHLNAGGIKQKTIFVLHNIIKPAFDMAVDDDIIRKNPFKFRLSDVVPNDSKERCVLTKEQQKQYLQFVLDCGGNYYDDIVILLGTGLRVSELYGLTISDIDFDRRCINVRRQLCKIGNEYRVLTPKSKSSVRDIPMTDAVYLALKRVIKNRAHPKVEFVVDGCSGFLFLNICGVPKVAVNLERYMRHIRAKLETSCAYSMPEVTPHVLRHTFCTNAQQAGMDVKSLQYIMGHSNVSVTLGIYAHSNYESVERAFEQIVTDL